MGLSGTSEKALINSLCTKIDELNKQFSIPKTLKEFGIIEEEFKEKIKKSRALQWVMPAQVPIPGRSTRKQWKNCSPVFTMVQKWTFDGHSQQTKAGSIPRFCFTLIDCQKRRHIKTPHGTPAVNSDELLQIYPRISIKSLTFIYY